MRKRYGVIAAITVAVLLLLPAGGLFASPKKGGTGPLVCIDPGHGGSDPGAVGNGVEEKVVNLDIARRVRPIVESMGYEVVMTRDSDVYVSLEDRCRFANNQKADIFVSIHNNAYLTTSEGTETFCYYDSVYGRRLATFIHRQVMDRIELKDRGVKEAGFYVLKHTDMPAALIEGAFITNPAEAELLQDPDFRQDIAEGVAAGIDDYLVDPGLFDTYLLLMNPDTEQTAELELSFMRGDGVEEVFEEEVPPGYRVTLHVDEYVFNQDVSTVVRSTNGVPVVAERAVYFDFERGNGGHGSPGVLSPSTDWYLAEGSTDWGYSTFVLVQNPLDEANRCVVELLRSDGHHFRQKYELEPHSRFTIDAGSVPGFEEADFSTRVEAEKPVVVERAMYWGSDGGVSGGHGSPGVNKPARRWYLAEGYTGRGFDTFLLLQNPASDPCTARVSYLLPDGENISEYHNLLPYSRKTIHVDEVPGLEDTDASFRVDSNLPVVVERSVYFDYFGICEGSNSCGACSLCENWFFAEGYTGQGFDTYILLANPDREDTQVTLRFLLSDGEEVLKGVNVPAGSRRTVKVDDVEGMESVEFATQVLSRQPVMAERSMYFSMGEKSGGHTAVGVTGPALEWYFAEGCTR